MSEQDQNPDADAVHGSDPPPAGAPGASAPEVAGAAAPDPVPAAAAPAVHGGQLLRQARESAGLHVAALAVSLKVPVRQIEALEQGAFDRLPDPIFVRALASSVCRQLRVDPKPILAALPQAPAKAPRVGGGINEPFNRPGMPTGQGLSRLALRPPVLIAAALLLAALLLLLLPPLFDDAPAGSDAAPASPAATPEPTAAGSEASPPAAGASGLPSAGGQGGVVVEQVQPLPLPGAAPGPAGTPATPATPTPARTP